MTTDEMTEQLRRQVEPILKEGLGFRHDIVSMLASAYLQGALDARSHLFRESSLVATALPIVALVNQQRKRPSARKEDHPMNHLRCPDCAAGETATSHRGGANGPDVTYHACGQCGGTTRPRWLECRSCFEVVDLPEDDAAPHLCREGDARTYTCPECRADAGEHVAGCAVATCAWCREVATEPLGPCGYCPACCAGLCEELWADDELEPGRPPEEVA